MADTEKPDVGIPVIFEGYEDVPIMLVNNFVLQRNNDGAFVLTLAQSTPPIFYGTDEEQREQRSLVQSVTGRTIARVALAPTTLRNLATLFESAVILLDEQGAEL